EGKLELWRSSSHHHRAYKPSHLGRPRCRRSPEAGYYLRTGLGNWTNRGSPRRRTLLLRQKLTALEQLNSQKVKIDLDLKYPLYLRRFKGEERVVLVDAVSTPIAHFVNYNHAYEIVRLTNAAYKLVSDLSQKPYENPASTPRDLGRSEAGTGISDPAQAYGP